MDGSTALNIKDLGVGGLLAILIIREIISFTKWVIEKIPSFKKNYPPKPDKSLSDFINYIKTNLSSLLGRNIDAVKDLDKCTAIINRNVEHINTKVTRIHEEHRAIVQDVDLSIKSAFKDTHEMFNVLNERLIKLKCVESEE